MKILNILLTLLIITYSTSSCSQKLENSNSKLETTISQNIKVYLENTFDFKKDDLIIDTISIEKIDTLTEYLDSLYSIRNLNMIKKELEEESKRINNAIETSHPDDFNYVKLERYSLELVDTIAKLGAEILVRHAKSTELDSIKGYGYSALINVEGHNSKKVSQTIKMHFLLDKNFHILEDRMLSLGLLPKTEN